MNSSSNRITPTMSGAMSGQNRAAAADRREPAELGRPDLGRSDLGRSDLGQADLGRADPGRLGLGETRTATGGHRPGEPRFDPIAWRQATAPERAMEMNEPLQAPVSKTVPAHPAAHWRYVASWACIGAISVAYLAAMGWQRSANLDTVLAPVTETLERLANDVAELRQMATDMDHRERATAARVAVTESRLDGFAQAASPLAAGGPGPGAQGQRPTNRTALTEEPTAGGPAPQAANEPAKPSRMIAGMIVVPAVAPGAAGGAAPGNSAVAGADPRGKATGTPTAKGAAAPLVNPVRTGTIAEPTTSKRPTGLLIASGPSLDSVRLSWNVLNQNHGAVLGALEPRIRPAADGSAFQLIAGPFASDAEATKACNALKARGVGCRYTDFGGSAL